MDDKQPPSVTLTQIKDYQFDIHYAPDRPALLSDEPPPRAPRDGASRVRRPERGEETVADIDRQLYAKYGLDDNEIEFIESHVKEMS